MEVEMQDTSNLTLNKIQQAAIDEFLEKGFRGASLRQIVKQGHFTGIFLVRRLCSLRLSNLMHRL